ncbi:MAG: hypothetical protein K8J08_10440 [Thermoanaerobaculia bacterium]|nr:hypothetical protein [Thermoanaerobaculia bacterium]
MDAAEALLIARLHRRFLWRRRLGVALAAGGVGFWPLWIATHSGLASGFWLAAVVLVAVVLAELWAPKQQATVQHLDRVVPSLEDSTELLLAEPNRLSPLARQQRERVEERLLAVTEPSLVSWRPLRRGAIVGLVVWIAGLVIWSLVSLPTDSPRQEVAPQASGASNERGEITVQIHHRLEPPSYAALEPIQGVGLGTEALAGTRVTWEATIEGVVEDLLLETPEGELSIEETSLGDWSWSLTATESVPLRLIASTAGTRRALTDWEVLSVRPDRPPEVRIEQPERMVEIDEDAVGALGLVVVVSDDLGLGSSVLVATLAQGAGENVEFRERRLSLPTGSGSSTERTIETRVDLRALGLEAGSELIFHVETSDRRDPSPQTGRSSSRIVRVRGGAEATVGLGRGLPLLLPPEVFRSQRQIILDTEALLAAKVHLAPQEVRRRSESIGFDQRALRMRYGSLLGEENVAAETVAVGLDHDDDAAGEHEHESEDPGGLVEESPLIAGVPGDLVHAHDSAEMATFFPDPVRSGLRRALAAMWDAERWLRGVEPAEALPFEQVALEELQGLKRATRVYVDRVGFDAPALDETRRLGGELEEIAPRRPPRRHAEPVEPLVEAYLGLGSADLSFLQLAEIMDSVDGVLELDAGDPSRLRWLDLRSEANGLQGTAEPVASGLRDRLRNVLWGWLEIPNPRPSRRILPALEGVGEEP